MKKPFETSVDDFHKEHEASVRLTESPAAMRERLINAAKNMDWEQIVLNHAYGPPCFYLEDGRFCGRAKTWFGHDGDPHDFVSFADLLQAAQPSSEKIEAVARRIAEELRRRCNTKLSLLHQSAWYESANELEKFAAGVLREELGGGK